MALKRTAVMDRNTSLSPMGDHFCRPPAVCPSVKISEMADAMRRKSVVVITCYVTSQIFHHGLVIASSKQLDNGGCHPGFRAGFRQQAQTAAKRLKLPVKVSLVAGHWSKTVNGHWSLVAGQNKSRVAGHETQQLELSGVRKPVDGHWSLVGGRVSG